MILSFCYVISWFRLWKLGPSDSGDETSYLLIISVKSVLLSSTELPKQYLHLIFVSSSTLTDCIIAQSVIKDTTNRTDGILMAIIRSLQVFFKSYLAITINELFWKKFKLKMKLLLTNTYRIIVANISAWSSLILSISSMGQ